jgi:hypothetical protein
MVALSPAADTRTRFDSGHAAISMPMTDCRCPVSVVRYVSTECDEIASRALV